MKFSIDYLPLTGEYYRNQARVSPNKEAAYRQTPKQHSDMLNKFKKAGMSPAQLMLAQRQGEQLEPARSSTRRSPRCASTTKRK